MNLPNKTRRWIRGLLEAVIHGGTSAIVSVMTANLLDKQDWGLSTNPGNFFKLLLATFTVNGLLRLAQYLSTHPLPDENDTAQLLQSGNLTPKISLSPLARVVDIPKAK